MFDRVASFVASPRDRVSLARFLDDLSNNKVALLLGAGTDIAMADAASWTQLVDRLFPTDPRPDSQLLSSWVVELATAARHVLGDEEYFSRIRKGIGSARRPTPLWSALKKCPNASH